LTPVARNAHPAITQAKALRIYHASAFDQKLPLVIQLIEYRHGWPPPATQTGRLAWAVTVQDAPVVSYGHAPVVRGTTEPFVVIIDSKTGRLGPAFQETAES
jgi:hypothetical protein